MVITNWIVEQNGKAVEGQDVFKGKKKDTREVCRCGLYSFPHKKNAGCKVEVEPVRIQWWQRYSDEVGQSINGGL